MMDETKKEEKLDESQAPASIAPDVEQPRVLELQEKQSNTSTRQNEEESSPSSPQQEEQVLTVRQNRITTIVVTLLHLLFIGLSLLTHFVNDWTDDSNATIWFSPTDGSVIQHLKMMLWPWLVVLLPMDVITKKLLQNKKGNTLYLNQISKSSSWVGVCMVTPISILSAMLFISIVFAMLYYGGSTSPIPDIALFIVAIVGGALLRIYLMAKPIETISWIAFGYLMFGLIWFFTYFSYSEDIYVGYWFNPHPHNLTSEDE
jgi:hypothetical protein